MRKLTIIPRFGDKSFALLEKIIESEFSDFFKNILAQYGGLSVYERYYYDKKNTLWEIGAFDNFISIHELTNEFWHAYKRKLIPFAYDPGGWHFCLCMDKKDYGCIFVNRWTDHLPEDQFLKIADSFEEFINGLKREDEVEL